VKEAGAIGLRGGAFKPRTSPYAFQGLAEEGLEISRGSARQNGAGDRHGSDVDRADPGRASITPDVLQIGARNMQNFNLLSKVGETTQARSCCKRGMSATLEEFLLAAEYIMARGNHQVILCERGIRTFEDYVATRLPLAIVPELHKRSHPAGGRDPSHGTGKRDLVDSMCGHRWRVGADGLILEVHNDPEHAMTDGAQSLTPPQFAGMMKAIKRIAQAVDREV
jgi:3-deoxy-7-phosphoheptulonate synthase